jgi:shikimate kinase
MMTKYKQPVPDSRTIVNGIWSDILDNWISSFDVSEELETELRVNLKNLTELESSSAFVLSGIAETLAEIRNEIRLLNARLESQIETGIDNGDVNEY